MQSIGTLAHCSPDSLARSSRIAIRASRNRLAGETLPNFAVKVGSVDHCAGIGVGADDDLLGYSVVERSSGVGGDDEGAARGEGCGVAWDDIDGRPCVDARDI